MAIPQLPIQPVRTADAASREAMGALMGLAYAFVMMREWRGSVVPAMVVHGISNGLVLGMLMDDFSGTVLAAPLLFPLMKELGIHPVHFAAILERIYLPRYVVT